MSERLFDGSFSEDDRPIRTNNSIEEMPCSDSPRFIGNSVASFGAECKFEKTVQI
jgi:hypothetical protein